MKLAASIPPMTVIPMTRREMAPAPFASGERHAAQNEGKGSHEDRPQPEFRARQGRLYNRLPLVVFHLGELDDENRVFRRQSDEHDQPDLDIDVVLVP